MTEYYLVIKWMKVLTHTSILMSTEKTHTCGGGTICAQDLMLHNSAISNTLNKKKIYAETRLVVSRGQGRGEIGATATEHKVSLWREYSELDSSKVAQLKIER